MSEAGTRPHDVPVPAPPAVGVPRAFAPLGLPPFTRTRPVEGDGRAPGSS